MAELLRKAEVICNYLKTSPQFSYSLDAVDRDLSLDPIIDFLTENPQGHCEYFSSALTLMLRSVGIRSRMIIGFQGGEWNHLGAYYQIRQKDAHSWSEAYIPPDELDGFSRGGWIRLDPTPGNSGVAGQTNSGVALRFYREMRNYAEFLWAKYVIQLDADRQQEDIYDRLTGWANTLIDATIEFLLVSEARQRQGNLESKNDGQEIQIGQKKLNWWRLALWITALLGLCGCVLLLRNRYRAGRARRTPTVKNHYLLEQRPFYRQWERLLVRYLAGRRPEQTPRQHAAQIAARLIDCGLGDQREVPSRVVDAHYAYAFGGTLPAVETEAELVQMITALGKALATKQRDALKTS